MIVVHVYWYKEEDIEYKWYLVIKKIWSRSKEPDCLFVGYHHVLWEKVNIVGKWNVNKGVKVDIDRIRTCAGEAQEISNLTP